MSNSYRSPFQVYTQAQVPGHGGMDGYQGAGELQSGLLFRSEFLSGQMSAAQSTTCDEGPLFDPILMHRRFPDLWKVYIRANFQSIAQVQRTFGVSERCVRKWLKGETGAKGSHVVVALNVHPVQAHQMLIAAE